MLNSLLQQTRGHVWDIREQTSHANVCECQARPVHRVHNSTHPATAPYGSPSILLSRFIPATSPWQPIAPSAAAAQPDTVWRHCLVTSVFLLMLLSAVIRYWTITLFNCWTRRIILDRFHRYLIYTPCLRKRSIFVFVRTLSDFHQF